MVRRMAKVPCWILDVSRDQVLALVISASAHGRTAGPLLAVPTRRLQGTVGIEYMTKIKFRSIR
jgi:hypothetical protein